MIRLFVKYLPILFYALVIAFGVMIALIFLNLYMLE
jgi:hypothetical protein